MRSGPILCWPCLRPSFPVNYSQLWLPFWVDGNCSLHNHQHWIRKLWKNRIPTNSINPVSSEYVPAVTGRLHLWWWRMLMRFANSGLGNSCTAQGGTVGYNVIEYIFSRETYLCSLNICCYSGKSPCPTWRLASICTGGTMGGKGNTVYIKLLTHHPYSVLGSKENGHRELVS